MVEKVDAVGKVDEVGGAGEGAGGRAGLGSGDEAGVDKSLNGASDGVLVQPEPPGQVTDRQRARTRRTGVGGLAGVEDFLEHHPRRRAQGAAKTDGLGGDHEIGGQRFRTAAVPTNSTRRAVRPAGAGLRW